MYDLIFMDIGLPDMDGISATKSIRANQKNANVQVPIVALTGHLAEDKRQTALAAGMNDVFSKPIKSFILEEILKRFIFGIRVQKESPQEEKLEPLIIDWKGCVKLYGNEASARELLDLCYAELKKTQIVLREAYKENNTKVLKDELHRCLGGVCYLRLPKLEHALRTFQAVVEVKPGGSDHLKKAYLQLDKVIEDFFKAYQQL